MKIVLLFYFFYINVFVLGCHTDAIFILYTVQISFILGRLNSLLRWNCASELIKFRESIQWNTTTSYLLSYFYWYCYKHSWYYYNCYFIFILANSLLIFTCFRKLPKLLYIFFWFSPILYPFTSQTLWSLRWFLTSYLTYYIFDP